MRMFGLAVVAIVMTAGSAFAQSGYTYDYRSGNSYNYYTSPGGQTTVRGSNLRTGSSWNTTIQRNGNMSGYDAGNNYWSYNARTGSYYNSGTIGGGGSIGNNCTIGC